jgi:hypothetical protein
MNMRRFGTHHGMKRLRHGFQRKNIGARAVEYEKNVGLCAEQVFKPLLQPLGNGVIAVRNVVSPVNLGNGRHDGGMNARMIIASKTVCHLFRID